jgi:hypothetical protein
MGVVEEATTEVGEDRRRVGKVFVLFGNLSAWNSSADE